GPVVPPKASPPSPQLQSSSELMTRAKRPRTRHHVKPLNAGWRAQEATTPLQPNLMSDRSHFARGASSDLLTTRKAPSGSRHDTKRMRHELEFNRFCFAEVFAVDLERDRPGRAHGE